MAAPFDTSITLARRACANVLPCEYAQVFEGFQQKPLHMTYGFQEAFTDSEKMRRLSND
jgi:hypothetical protein